MNGKNHFTQEEAFEIKKYLQSAREAGMGVQKPFIEYLRKELRFFITDFTVSRKRFTPENFDALVAEGKITIS
ncbi:hypothetical protein SAMN06265348_12423 [Pedobacter westerhofensis]|uniref:Uncharacterized protein n=1 Tax=Pedobacter westerhofensis TaxID=425512 RepID=A0A521FU43_9SPHI|nr:hypothetical protein [Pedobacter westerhofensis]SMO99632.1 hypothetical protein SAMN06265348_12423 [Pedobacter westerhofensis]